MEPVHPLRLHQGVHAVEAAADPWPLLVLTERLRTFDWRRFAAVEAVLVAVLFLLVTAVASWLGGWGAHLGVGAAAGLLLHWLHQAARIALGKR